MLFPINFPHDSGTFGQFPIFYRCTSYVQSPFGLTLRRQLAGAGELHRPARLEAFDCCIGLLELNSDQRVGKKMAESGDVLIPLTERSNLVQLSTADKPWL